MLNFMEILSVGVELFYADGQTGKQTDSLDEASIRFSPFCERP